MKRSLLILAFVLLWSQSAFASYALVAHTSAGSADGNSVISSAINTSGANLLLVIASNYSAINLQGTITDLVGGNSNTWHGLTIKDNGAVAVRIWWSTPTFVGSGHTFSITGTTIFPTITVLALSGSTASPFDQENGATVSAAQLTIQPGSVTPSEDNEIVITGLAWLDAGGATINSGFTISDQTPTVGGQSISGGAAYLIQTTATAVNPTWTILTSSGGAAAVSASFKAGAGGGATCNGGLLLLGAGGC